MNEKQSDQVEGFSELLDVAGSRITWDGREFAALVRTLQPQEERYDLTPGDDNTVGVRAFRSAFGETLPTIGACFVDELGTHYRVTRIIRTPGDLTVTFECEVNYP